MGSKSFSFEQAFDFNPHKLGMPLEIYFSKSPGRMYVTTAKPGHLNIFDLSDDGKKPRLAKSIPTAAGAHHVAFSPGEHYAFVQNSLLNLPGLSDGSITVINLHKQKVVAQIDVLKKKGMNPNCIVLLPKWQGVVGHH